MNWIFQSNPDLYDLTGAVAELDELNWGVRQYPNDIHSGDTVYLWESGEQAGIVAVGQVISEPSMLTKDDDKAFHRNAERFQNESPRVRLRIDYVLPERILKKTLLDHPILKDMHIMRWNRNSNYRLTDEQAAELERLVNF